MNFIGFCAAIGVLYLLACVCWVVSIAWSARNHKPKDSEDESE